MRRLLFRGKSWLPCKLQNDPLENKKWYKTWVIHDPLGKTHSPSSSDRGFQLKFALLWKVGTRTYVQTEYMCENSYHYRPWLWVGRVDQLHLLVWSLCALGYISLAYHHIPKKVKLCKAFREKIKIFAIIYPASRFCMKFLWEKQTSCLLRPNCTLCALKAFLHDLPESWRGKKHKWLKMLFLFVVIFHSSQVESHFCKTSLL